MRLTLTGTCLLTVLAATSLAAAADMKPTNPAPQQRLTFNARISDNVTLQYLLFLPADYDPNGSKRWPLILFLHGAGERGTNLDLVTVHGPPKIVQSRPDFPFIVVSPQCPPGERWHNDELVELLDYIEKQHRVDKKRVYLTGLSMGGYGTWNLGLAHPKRFAAIAPICGGGDTIQILLPEPKKVAPLKSLPVWAFHGARDSTVPVQESERMIAALKKAGATGVKLTVYPDAEHDSWTETYNNPELYDWFLAHQRER
jgi:predicted peptidase